MGIAEKELIDLTLAIVAINGWNRQAIAFKTVPGTFQTGIPPLTGPAAQGATDRRDGSLKGAKG